jgi:hypothetical protein
MTDKAFFLRSCQKRHLQAYSTEHAKDLRPIEEVQRNPDDGLNFLNLYDFIKFRPICRNRSMLAARPKSGAAAIESGNNYPRRQTLPNRIGNLPVPSMKSGMDTA